MIRREDALEYHGGERPGLIDVRLTRPCATAREMRLAYLPGATFACTAITEDQRAAVRCTGRGNLVALVTNGSAVPGLGAVGPLAAKPLQEGMALLFKRLADINVFDIEVAAVEPERVVDAVRAIEPGFGGVVLSHIRAPEGLAIHDQLCATLQIPVLHENLQGTAVVVAAALINAAELAGKDVDALRVVFCGAGTLGLGFARLLRRLGVPGEQLQLFDERGLLHPERTDLTPYQREFAQPAETRTLAGALRGADVFIGASTGGVLTDEMVRTMARFPIVFALATPEPEIGYEVARAARRDVIVATALAEHPNAMLDLLSFPYLMRGALDVQATRISDGMLLAAARALADLAREEVVDEVSRAYADQPLSFGPEYLLPKPIDPRILVRQSAAVALCAIDEGVAGQAVEAESYQEQLRVRMGTGRETLRRLMVKARRECPRVVFPEGTHETILRAARILADEGVARPILLGSEGEIRAAMARVGIEPSGAAIVDPGRSPHRDSYADTYYRSQQRKGLMRSSAVQRMRQPEYFAAMMLHHGDADLMISGAASHYADSMRVILQVIGTTPGVRCISSHYLAILPRHLYILARGGRERARLPGPAVGQPRHAPAATRRRCDGHRTGPDGHAPARASHPVRQLGRGSREPRRDGRGRGLRPEGGRRWSGEMSPRAVRPRAHVECRTEDAHGSRRRLPAAPGTPRRAAAALSRDVVGGGDSHPPTVVHAGGCRGRPVPQCHPRTGLSRPSTPAARRVP
jgi:malate dehydrogenase (oxaloacetate-decarboxylating)(NADP+)